MTSIVVTCRLSKHAGYRSEVVIASDIILGTGKYLHIYETTRPIFANFLYVLPTAVARSCGVEAIYVFPVLWMA